MKKLPTVEEFIRDLTGWNEWWECWEKEHPHYRAYPRGAHRTLSFKGLKLHVYFIEPGKGEIYKLTTKGTNGQEVPVAYTPNIYPYGSMEHMYPANIRPHYHMMFPTPSKKLLLL